MAAGWNGRGLGLALSMVAMFGAGAQTSDAQARPAHTFGYGSSRGSHYPASHYSASRYVAWRGGSPYAHRGYTSVRRWASSGLQCVPFARENSGIELSGNAGTWWENAEGLYERGAKPEVGSILNFRATGRIRMGHVAVVTNVLDGRHIQIDHANWASPGLVSRDIDVVDVSPANDWTAVRVELDHTNEFGSVYPTYGFIYDRPDNGTMLANNTPAPAPVLNPAPFDLRPAGQRIEQAAIPTAPEEVAEAADDGPDSGDDAAAGSTRAWHRWNHHHARLISHRVAAYPAHPTPARAPRSAALYRVASRENAPAPWRHRHRF